MPMFIPKMLIFSSDDKVFVNEDSDNSPYFSDDMGISTKCLNINSDDVNFDDDDPKTIIHVRFMA